MHKGTVLSSRGTVKSVLVKPLTNKNLDLCCMDIDTSIRAWQNTTQITSKKYIQNRRIMLMHVSDMCV